MMMHSHSRPSFLPVPRTAGPEQVKLATYTLGAALTLVAATVAIIVRFL